MSSLRSALEEWKAEDLTGRSREELGEDLVEIEGVSAWLEAERARRLAAFEDADGLDLQGHSSATAFLKHRCQMAAGRAHQVAAMAHHLPELSRVAQALDEGMVSVDQVRVLLGAGERLNEEFVRDQGLLLEAVSGLSVADTRRLLSYWRDA